MSTDRLLTWSLARNALVPLVRTDHEGGQTILYEFEKDPSMVAGVPVPGQDLASYWAKVKALIAEKIDSEAIAWPEEILVSPRDRSTPVAFSMKKIVGHTLELLLLPAERQALGLRWGGPEFLAIANLLCDLFAFTEHNSFTQNDCHPGQYIVTLDRKKKMPESVVRVDTLAFSFWHGQVPYGTDGARWEYVPPELQWLGRRPQGLKGYDMPREADRFALGSLLFSVFTGGSPTDYAGGDPDPAARVEKKNFAVISMPAGATVAPEVERAFYSLPTEVVVVLERALLGEPTKRPKPSEIKKALKALSTPGAGKPDHRYGFVTTAIVTARRLVKAGRANGWWIAAAACVAGAAFLFPRSEQPALRTEMTPPRPLSAALHEDDSGDIPPPPRQPSRRDTLPVLNRKAPKR